MIYCYHLEIVSHCKKLTFLSICNHWLWQECPPGSFGIDCQEKCPPQFYGRFCREKCSCDPCNKITGCLKVKSE